MYSQAEMIPPCREQSGNAKVCLSTGHGWKETPPPQKRVCPYLLLPVEGFPMAQELLMGRLGEATPFVIGFPYMA